MEYLLSIFLGVVQGLTEFLPVSSSGHLVLFQHLFGLKEPELLFDIGLHVGTLAAICSVFPARLYRMISSLLRLPALIRESGGIRRVYEINPEIRTIALIGIASIPTAIIGLWIESAADQIFRTPWITGLTLLVTGTFLWLTRQVKAQERSISTMTVTAILLIGVAQGVAVLPGISRSGATISAALFLGMNREDAGAFSFLLSIPAVLGALLLSVNSPLTQGTVSGNMIFLGAITAAVVGYVALKVLLGVVKKGRLHYFAPYCWAVGILVLMISGFYLSV
ncbi:MAG: undecaprenyl-diphosphate phosphatase [Thermodesulfobacteriota bacterium]